MIVVLCGGFGAARLVEGIDQATVPLTCIVNVGDDFDHLGLRVCPDLDSILYALAGRFDDDRGWGPTADTMMVNRALARYGDDWFQLGDQDLALALERTERLRHGEPLSAVTTALAEAWGVTATVLPATDDPVPTRIRTPGGWLGFQDFVVRHRGRPKVMAVAYENVEAAAPAPGVLDAIARADVLVIAPSNPVSSIAPILAVPGVRVAVAARRRPSVAVTPVALAREPSTGPERSRTLLREVFMAAAEVDHRPSAVAVLYRDLIDGFVVDERDPSEADAVRRLGLRVLVADTLAPRGAARADLARRVIEFGTGLPVAR